MCVCVCVHVIITRDHTHVSVHVCIHLYGLGRWLVSVVNNVLYLVYQRKLFHIY